MKKAPIKTLTSVLGSLLLAGCGGGGGGSSAIVPNPQNPQPPAPVLLQAEVIGQPAVSQYLTLLGTGSQNLDHLMQFDTTTGQVSASFPNIGNQVRIFHADGLRVFGEENVGSASPMTDVDFVAFNFLNQTRFDSNLPGSHEFFDAPVKDGALVSNWDNTTGRRTVMKFNGSSLVDLFPQATSVHYTPTDDLNMHVLRVEESPQRWKVYTLDGSVANAQPVLRQDLTASAVFGVSSNTTPDVAVAYQSSLRTDFYHITHGITTFDGPLQTHGYVDHLVEGADALMYEVTPTGRLSRAFHVDLENKTSTAIVPPTGWDFDQKDVIGSDYILFGGDGSPGTTPDVLFFNKTTKQLEDLLTPLSPTGAIDYAFLDHVHKGKALLEVGDGQQDHVFVFTGAGVAGHFLQQYSSSHSLGESVNERYVAVRAQRTSGTDSDLCVIDMESSTLAPTIIKRDVFARSVRISNDGMTIAYLTRDAFTNEDILNVYKRATNQDITDILRADDIDLGDFSDDSMSVTYGLDDSNVVHGYHLDLASMKSTFISDD